MLSCGTSHQYVWHVIMFGSQQDDPLIVEYVNSDYGGNLDGGMPITWYVFILVDESLCWKFIVTMSTTKIEYKVIVKASKEVV